MHAVGIPVRVNVLNTIFGIPAEKIVATAKIRLQVSDNSLNIAKAVSRRCHWAKNEVFH